MTNFTVFTWSIDTVLSTAVFETPRDQYLPTNLDPFAHNVKSASTITYNGTNLDSCDFIRISVNANPSTWVTTFEATVLCNNTCKSHLID